MAQDLRSFLLEVEEKHPEQFLRVREPLNRRFEVTALVMELEKAPACPVVLFEDVAESNIPLVTNILASRSRLALAMGVPEEELVGQFSSRIKAPIPAVRRESAPFQENVFLGEEVDLRRFPILTHFEQDGGPYITGGLLVARDPLSRVQTAGYHRLMLKGPRRLGLSLHSRRRMWEYQRRAEELGRPLDVAIVIGVHPLISLGSLTFPPSDMDKLDVMGGLFGEPLEVVRCQTVDVDVPRWAEMVIEGQILCGVREREGPFGEFTGYASSRGTENVFEAQALQFRDSAIYQEINPSLSKEHCRLLALPREVEFTNLLRRTIPNLRAVHVPVRSGCGSFHCYVSLRKTAEGQPKQAIFSVLGADHYIKLVVVVDEDVDIFDEEEILWAIATRMQADKDVFVIPGAMGTVLDPSSPEAISAKMGIDATKPLGDFPVMLTLPREAMQRAKEMLKSIN